MVRQRVRRPDPPDTAVPQLYDGAQTVHRPFSDPNLTVMGIDQSLTGTGIAVINHHKIVAKTLSPPKDCKFVSRLSWFREQITREVRAYAPQAVAIEGYGFGARNSHSHSLGELGGVIKLSVRDNGIPFFVVPPTSLKMFVTGKGNSPKTIMGKELYKRFGIDLDDDNQVDAAGLALMVASYFNAFDMTAFQKKAMEKVVEMAENK